VTCYLEFHLFHSLSLRQVHSTFQIEISKNLQGALPSLFCNIIQSLLMSSSSSSHHSPMLPSIFPPITWSRRQFLRKMCTVHSPLILTVCRIFLSSRRFLLVFYPVYIISLCVSCFQNLILLSYHHSNVSSFCNFLIIIIIIIYLSCSWANCWPVPVSRSRKCLQRSIIIPSASRTVVLHYPG